MAMFDAFARIVGKIAGKAEEAKPAVSYAASNWGKGFVTVEAKVGEDVVGTLHANISGMVPSVEVNEGFRRQGIATEMYRLAGEKGATFPPAGQLGGRSEEGKAFRAGLEAKGIKLPQYEPPKLSGLEVAQKSNTFTGDTPQAGRFTGYTQPKGTPPEKLFSNFADSGKEEAPEFREAMMKRATVDPRDYAREVMHTTEAKLPDGRKVVIDATESGNTRVQVYAENGQDVVAAARLKSGMIDSIAASRDAKGTGHALLQWMHEQKIANVFEVPDRSPGFVSIQKKVVAGALAAGAAGAASAGEDAAPEAIVAPTPFINGPGADSADPLASFGAFRGWQGEVQGVEPGAAPQQPALPQYTDTSLPAGNPLEALRAFRGWPSGQAQDARQGEETVKATRATAHKHPTVQVVSSRLGIDPQWLSDAINFETGGTYSPSVRNKQSGATGLIQFMPKTARSLGTTTDALASMSFDQQMGYVERYLEPYKGRLKNLGDVYSAILWPAAVGKDDNFVLFKQGTKAYEQNAGLDKAKKGYVTRADALAAVQRNAK